MFIPFVFPNYGGGNNDTFEKLLFCTIQVLLHAHKKYGD